MEQQAPETSGPDTGDVINPFPPIRPIGWGAPLRWLRLGVADLMSCPVASLFYGFCFAGMGLLITFVFAHHYEYTVGLTSGFLLLGPFVSMGLYEISRRRELGEPCALAPTLTIWRRNISNIGVFAVVLGITFLIWARASLVVFALFYTSEMPSIAGFLDQVVRLENIEFLAVYFAVGGFFALLVFSVSVVSIPLMLDRDKDAITSMLTSIRALFTNLGPLLLWAVLIVLLTIVGFLSFHLGLIVAMPVIGHASWHAYRELVAPPEDVAAAR